MALITENFASIVTPVLLLAALFSGAVSGPAALSQEPVLRVQGEVLTRLSLSLGDIKALPAFFLPGVPVISEQARREKDGGSAIQTSFRGVLLRDLLLKAGMKHSRKWEPGVYVRARAGDGRETAFSFGEIFYSSIGRSLLVAYERDARPCPLTLVVGTDVYDGRMLAGVSDITVARVELELLAYDDKDNQVVRPPSTQFVLVDTAAGSQWVIKPADLRALPTVHLPAVVLIGECEGFHGIHSLDGVPLAVLLKHYLKVPDPAPYHGIVVVSSDDGYCATFSFGELFNSRLGRQAVIAMVKDGRPLSPADGFAMSACGEDSTGGRSVRRIHRIEVR